MMNESSTQQIPVQVRRTFFGTDVCATMTRTWNLH